MRAPDTDLPIAFTDVTVTAGGVTILDRLTLTVASGAPTVLIGPNGSGKTTLMRAAMELMPLTQGTIQWGGRNWGGTDSNRAALARRAILFQRPVMLRRSAAANLQYAMASAGVPRAQQRSRATELLALVGLSGLGERPARRLSGGEQQRLALARALARDPAVLFLDEPTASLDPAATKAIEDVVRAVAARGVKIVMSTHDLGQARRIAGDVVLMHRGRVIEHAPVQDFFADPKTEEAKRFTAGELLV
jgi:tungstate transport system ATP-binding protein